MATREPRPSPKPTTKRVAKTAAKPVRKAKPTPVSHVRREDVQALDDALHELKGSIDTAVSTAVDRKNRTWRNLFIVVGTVMALLVATIVVLGVVVVKQGDDRADLAAVVTAQQSDLLQRRVDACERDNTTRAASRQVASTTSAALNQFAALLVGNRPIDAELQQQINDFQANVINPLLVLVDAEKGPFADRDCSPQALALPDK